MTISVTFRNLESNEILRQYAEEKIAKLRKYLDHHPLEASVVLTVEKHRHLAEINLLANRITIVAQEEMEDMFSAIDRVVDKVERQIRKYKEKIKKHKVPPGLPESSLRVNVYAADSFDQGEPKLIKSQRQVAKPMSVEEAAMQLELLNSHFLVFTNVDSKVLNILYRRKDGHLGLIEPQPS